MIQDAPSPLQSSPGFGAYEVERVLGEGAMGRVYQARHHALERRVAIKALHPALAADPALVERFLQEARLVSTINHPNIVQCFDVVAADGNIYAVMELLDGETLSARLERRPLSMAEVVEVARQLALAVEAAHAVNVVHRDLKPDNVILVSRDGAVVVKVLDFGVAKLLPESGVEVVKTQAGVVMGTPLYMSPEQVAGLEVDGRADVYAWGALVFEMIAGHPPFTATSFGQLAAQIISGPVPAVPARSASGSPVPAGLAELVRACLAKKPAKRPSSMREVRQALEAIDRRRLHLRARWGAAAALLGMAAVSAMGLPSPQEPHLEADLASLPALPAWPPAPPPSAVVRMPDDVSLSLVTRPPGARVRGADGAVLGVTPLSLRRPRGSAPVPVLIELEGYRRVRRVLPTAESLRLELSLSRIRPARRASSRDVTLEPF